MTPPPPAPKLEASAEAALARARRVTEREQRARLRPQLNPAKPVAVILPPLVLYLYAIGATVFTRAMVGDAGAATLFRAGLIAAILLPMLYFVRAAVENLDTGRLAPLLLPALASILVLALDALVPGRSMGWVTQLVLLVSAAVSLPLGRLWRDWWVRHRPVRVTLLTSSEWGADDATRRLEEIPGLSVTNAVIPGADAERATRLLGRPVTDGARSAVRLEKRVVVSSPMRDPAVGTAIAQLVALGHTISSESSVMRAAEGRVDTDRADPLNLLLSAPSHWFTDGLSRVIDVLAALVLLVVLSPVFLVAALAIMIESGRPIFYRQRRVGFRGRLIDVIKFRSMYRDAESRSGPVWASENDPRITKVGRILRKYRIDELPQLWNVLKGEMALVGPRPERPHFFEELRREVPIFELRTCVRPGVTGWAQVRAPYASNIADSRTKLEYDLFYVLRRSPLFDLAILVETVGVAVRGRGSR